MSYLRNICFAVLFLWLLGINFNSYSQNQFGEFYKMARKVSQLSIDSAENPERWHAHNYMMFLLLNPRLNFVDLATFDKHQVFNTKYKNGKLTMATVNFESSRNGLNIRSDLNVVSIEILNKYDIGLRGGENHVHMSIAMI